MMNNLYYSYFSSSSSSKVLIALTFLIRVSYTSHSLLLFQLHHTLRPQFNWVGQKDRECLPYFLLNILTLGINIMTN